MLKIIDKPKFSGQVTVNTAHLKGSFTATFIAMPTSKLRALEEAAVMAGKGPQGVLYSVVESFDQVTVDDSPISTLDELLDHPGVGPAMLARYYKLLWEEASGN